jgi:hypothetical protein
MTTDYVGIAKNAAREFQAKRILALIDTAGELDSINDRRGCWRAREELRAVRDQLRSDFARQRGWLEAKTDFSLRQLRAGHAGRYTDRDHIEACAIDHPWIDHPEHFRWPTRPYRPAAIITHAYTSPDDLTQYAAEHDLGIEFLPWSWYYPGHCTAAALTRKSNVVPLRRREAA